MKPKGARRGCEGLEQVTLYLYWEYASNNNIKSQ